MGLHIESSWFLSSLILLLEQYLFLHDSIHPNKGNKSPCSGKVSTYVSPVPRHTDQHPCGAMWKFNLNSIGLQVCTCMLMSNMVLRNCDPENSYVCANNCNAKQKKTLHANVEHELCWHPRSTPGSLNALLCLDILITKNHTQFLYSSAVPTCSNNQEPHPVPRPLYRF